MATYQQNEVDYRMDPFSERLGGAGLYGDLARKIIGLGFEKSGRSRLASNITDLHKISGGNIAGALRKSFGIGASMPAAMFTPISEQLTRGLNWETYQPMLQQKQQSLSKSLIDSLASKQARLARGGFAGSAAGQTFEKTARDVYGQGMTGELGKVAAQRTKSYASVSDQINNWINQAQTFKTGG